MFDSTSPEARAAASAPASNGDAARSPTSHTRSPVVEQVLAAVEGHEVWAAGAAGAVGGLALAALASVLGR